MIDYYQKLGVSRTSEDVVIRAAYLALMRRYHPDTNQSSSAAERAREITTAYEVLSDKNKRAAYDRRDFDRHESAVFEPPRRPPVGLQSRRLKAAGRKKKSRGAAATTQYASDQTGHP